MAQQRSSSVPHTGTRAAVERSIVSAEEKHARGIALYEDGRFQEALTVLEEALRESEPAPAHFWNDWSAAAFACGQLDKAEEGFKKALELNRGDSQAAANLGTLLAGLGRVREAIPFLGRAAAGCDEWQRYAVSGLLEACRNKVVADALSQSRAAFRELIPEPPPTAPLEPRDSQSSEYWFPEITGWFSCQEALHLYTVIKLMRPRRILEIGTFYGRSTASICAAIKSLNTSVKFITIDFDLRTEEEVKTTFGQIHCVSDVPMPFECREAFELGLSTTGYAKYQLEKHGLARFVKFASGDFREVPGVFDLVFADVLHERNEIQRNLAVILSKIECGGILAAHDLSDENKKLIDSLSNTLEFISRCGTLGIYRVSAKPERQRPQRKRGRNS